MASRVTNKLTMKHGCVCKHGAVKESSMLREMQKWFPRLLLIPSPPSSFNQTVNHRTVSYGFIAAPNCTAKVQGFANRVQDRLHSKQLIKEVFICIFLAEINGCFKNLQSDTQCAESIGCKMYCFVSSYLLACVNFIKM